MTGHIPQEQISAWSDRQLDPSGARLVEEHIKACDSCRAFGQEMTNVNEMFRSAGTLELPPYLWTRISAALDEASPVRAAGIRSLTGWASFVPGWLRAPALALASVVLLAGGVVLVRHIFEGRSQELTLTEIDRTYRSALASLQSESFNPFYEPTSVDREANPFSQNKLDVSSNPFRSASHAR